MGCDGCFFLQTIALWICYNDETKVQKKRCPNNSGHLFLSAIFPDGSGFGLQEFYLDGVKALLTHFGFKGNLIPFIYIVFQPIDMDKNAVLRIVVFNETITF